MALIAKEVLRIGHTVAALPGNVVAPEAVEKYGWADKVEDNGKGSDAAGTSEPAAPRVAPVVDKRAPK